MQENGAGQGVNWVKLTRVLLMKESLPVLQTGLSVQAL